MSKVGLAAHQPPHISIRKVACRLSRVVENARSARMPYRLVRCQGGSF